MKKFLTITGLFLVLAGCSNKAVQQPIISNSSANYHEIETTLTSAVVDDLNPIKQIQQEKENLIKNGQSFWFDEKKVSPYKEEMYYLQYLSNEVKGYKDHFPPKFKMGTCDNDGWCKIISPEIPKKILAISSKNTANTEFYASSNGEFYTFHEKNIYGSSEVLTDIYENDKILFSKKMEFGASGPILNQTIINDSPSFTFREPGPVENTFYKGETMNEKYKVDDSENLFVVNGKIGFVATVNGKKFIMYDGKKVSQDFDEIRTHACCAISAYPFEIDQNGTLSLLAKRGEKYYLVEIKLALETQSPSETTTPTINQTPQTSYENKELGIKFTPYWDGIYAGTFEQQENKIVFKDPMVKDLAQAKENGYKAPFIQVFTKPKDQKIDDAILDVIKKENKDSSKCKVIDYGQYWAKNSFENYSLDLVNQKIIYTKDEEKEIKQADIDSKKDGGPFDGEWQKAEIYRKRLVSECSPYADSLKPGGTSKTMPSIFLYDEKTSNTKFIFIPGSADPYFFKEDSLEILK
ncbi:MAG: hypothetical protein NTZ25_04130 [Candidatus Peregrinibacteria bacterium]|nr:hypothetical protein [Candidatus Peregrinibacteria bacterium]